MFVAGSQRLQRTAIYGAPEIQLSVLGGNGKVYPVVDEKQGPELTGAAPDDRSELEERPGFEVLVPELHDVDARLEDPGQELVQGPCRRVTRRHEVETCGEKAFLFHSAPDHQRHFRRT